MNSTMKPHDRDTRNQRRNSGRTKQSPVIALVNLLFKTRRQLLGLPTEEQAVEMERLLPEVQRIFAYRAAHPNWREEDRWS